LTLGSILGEYRASEATAERAHTRTKTEDRIIFPQGQYPGKRLILTPKLEALI